jgi:hypothetical protein
VGGSHRGSTRVTRALGLVIRGRGLVTRGRGLVIRGRGLASGRQRFSY